MEKSFGQLSWNEKNPGPFQAPSRPSENLNPKNLSFFQALPSFSKPFQAFPNPSKPFQAQALAFHTFSKLFQTLSKPFQAPSRPSENLNPKNLSFFQALPSFSKPFQAFPNPSKPFQAQALAFHTFSKLFQTLSKLFQAQALAFHTFSKLKNFTFLLQKTTKKEVKTLGKPSFPRKLKNFTFLLQKTTKKEVKTLGNPILPKEAQNFTLFFTFLTSFSRFRNPGRRCKILLLFYIKTWPRAPPL